MAARSRNTDTCEHCIFWQRGFRLNSLEQIKFANEGFQAEHGECRFNPPTLGGVKQWPETYAEDWCGQWSGDA